MRRSRFSEEQVIGILKEHQAGLRVAIGANSSCMDGACIAPQNEHPSRTPLQLPERGNGLPERKTPA